MNIASLWRLVCGTFFKELPPGTGTKFLDGLGRYDQVTLTTDVTGVLPVANGGTNSSTALNNNRLVKTSGGAIVEFDALTNGQLPIGSTGAAPVAAAITAGTGITVTNGAGSIAIAATVGQETGCDVYHSTTQSVNDATDTALTFDTETRDTDAFHSTSSNTGRITIPAALGGWYLFGAHVPWTGSSTGVRKVYLKVNGSTASTPVTMDLSLGDFNHELVQPLYLSGSDYVEVFVRQESGGALNVLANARFWAVKVSGTAAAVPPQNILINGGMDWWSRQLAPGTASARSDDAYINDRWYVLTQTAAVNCERSTGDVARYASKITQNQVAAQRLGLAQIVEGIDSKPHRSRTVGVQVKVKISNSQAVRLAILEWTGTEDAVTSDVVLDWASATYTANNFFLAANLTIAAVTSATPSAATWTTISTTASISASCNNLIVFAWTEGTAAQNVTLELTEWGLYDSGSTQLWTPRPVAAEKTLCERFLAAFGGTDTAERVGAGPAYSTTQWGATCPLQTTLRADPSVTLVTAANTWSAWDGVSQIAATAVAVSTGGSLRCPNLDCTVAAGLTTGRTTQLIANGTASALLLLDAEL